MDTYHDCNHDVHARTAWSLMACYVMLGAAGIVSVLLWKSSPILLLPAIAFLLLQWCMSAAMHCCALVVYVWHFFIANMVAWLLLGLLSLYEATESRFAWIWILANHCMLTLSNIVTWAIVIRQLRQDLHLLQQSDRYAVLAATNFEEIKVETA
jgi:hypothetical protein